MTHYKLSDSNLNHSIWPNNYSSILLDEQKKPIKSNQKQQQKQKWR